MAVNYKGLWKVLIDRELKKTEVREALKISSSTFAKMNRNEYVSLEILDKLCSHLNCNIGDIVEHVSDKKVEE